MENIKGNPMIRLAVGVNNLKIIGKADEKEKAIIYKLIMEDILKANSNYDEKMLIDKLNKSNIYYTDILGFSGPAALNCYKDIFINRSIYELVSLGDFEEIRKLPEYKAVFHETLHVLQDASSKKGNVFAQNLTGMIEGATEKECVEYFNEKRSTISQNYQYNFKTSSVPYVPCIIIMQQLEAMYGKDIVQRFTYNFDLDLINTMKNDLGNELTKTIISCTNLWAKNKKTMINIGELQDQLMNAYFTKRVYACNTKEEANQVMNQLLSLGNRRLNIFNNNNYENYYNTMLEVLKVKNLFDERTPKFVMPEFYEYYNQEDIKNLFKRQAKDYCSDALGKYLFEEGISPRNSEELVSKANEFFGNYNPKFFDYITDNNAYNIFVDGDMVRMTSVRKDEKGLEKISIGRSKLSEGKALLNTIDGEINVSVDEKGVLLTNTFDKQYHLQETNNYDLNEKDKLKLLRGTVEELRLLKETKKQYEAYKDMLGYDNNGNRSR